MLRELLGKRLGQSLQSLRRSRLLYLRMSPGESEQQIPEAKVGIYKEKAAFAAKACKLTHPFDGKSKADDILLKSIFKLLVE